MRAPSVAPFGLVALLAACGGATRIAPVPPAHVAALRAAALPSPIDEPRLAITFAPHLEPAGLEVRIRARAWPDMIHWSSFERAFSPPVVATDAAGPVACAWKDGALALAREPSKFVELVYDLPSTSPAAARALAVSPSGVVRFTGDVLVLPKDAVGRVTIDFDLARAPLDAVASSFGFGKHVETSAAASALWTGAWIGGPVYSARFDAYEGKDDFAWAGYSAFDTRWIAAEVATLRTAIRTYFGESAVERPPMIMLFANDRKTTGAPIEVLPTFHGMLAVADTDAAWSASARLQVSETLVMPRMPQGMSAEQKRGFARHVARQVLLGSGTFSPQDYAADVNGALAVVRLAPMGERGAPAPAVGIALASLAAATVDPRLRECKQSLRDVLRDASATSTSPRDKLRACGGANAVDAFDHALATGDLPLGALGPCFERAKVTFERFDLGFDVAEARVTHARFAARKAGIRDGDEIVETHIEEGNTASKARVTVKREGKELPFAYRPVGETKVEMGWRVVPGVDPATCGR